MKTIFFILSHLELILKDDDDNDDNDTETPDHGQPPPPRDEIPREDLPSLRLGKSCNMFPNISRQFRNQYRNLWIGSGLKG